MRFTKDPNEIINKSTSTNTSTHFTPQHWLLYHMGLY